MPVELVVPSVGESITQVEIGEWLKTPGEAVTQDEPVVIIETDKVTVELPAPASGTITEMLKLKGDKAAVGDVIGYMEPNGGSGGSPPQMRRGEPGPKRGNTTGQSINEGPGWGGVDQKNEMTGGVQRSTSIDQHHPGASRPPSSAE